MTVGTCSRKEASGSISFWYLTFLPVASVLQFAPLLQLCKLSFRLTVFNKLIRLLLVYF